MGNCELVSLMLLFVLLFYMNNMEGIEWLEYKVRLFTFFDLINWSLYIQNGMNLDINYLKR